MFSKTFIHDLNKFASTPVSLSFIVAEIFDKQHCSSKWQPWSPVAGWWWLKYLYMSSYMSASLLISLTFIVVEIFENQHWSSKLKCCNSQVRFAISSKIVLELCLKCIDDPAKFQINILKTYQDIEWKLWCSNKNSLKSAATAILDFWSAPKSNLTWVS